MAEQFLQKLIAIIENPDCVVLWNDNDKFYLLKNKVYYGKADEARVFFQGFKGRYIDIYNTTVVDFKFFGKEKEMSEILEEVRL